MTPAILFLIFNRPDTTARVFEAIRAARPARLYVVADGSRPHRVGEAERCSEARRIATAVDWSCEVRTLFHDSNLGCREAVSGGITWFFQHEPEGIVLEDDCLPHHSFFSYCEELLNRYRERASVMSICGSSFVRRPLHKWDYSFTYFPNMWGWASWRRAWHGYSSTMKQCPQRMHHLNAFFSGNPELIDFWKHRFDQVENEKIDTWDYQWAWHVISNNGLCVTPHRNLVSNIGFRHDATHTREQSYLEKRPLEGLVPPLSHPKTIARDFALERAISISRWNICRRNRFLRQIDNLRRKYYLATTYSQKVM